jgi:ABC-type bacteriocin/lantibiotic exporter with double-glycine peptidase domain
MKNLKTVFIKIMQDLGWVRGTFFACSIFVLPLSEALGLALLLTFVQSVFFETTTLFPGISNFIKNNFNFALVVLVLLFFFKLILEIGIRLFSIKIIDDSRKKMTVDIFHGIVEGNYLRNIAISSGEKIRNLNEVGTVFQSLIIPLFALSIEVVTVIAVIGLAFNFIGNDLMVSLAGIFFLLYLFSKILKKYLQTWGKIRVETAAKINQNLIETFRAWEEIRANRFVSKLASKLASDFHQYLKVQRFAQTSFGSVKSSVEFLVIFFSAVFLWYKFGTGLDQSFTVDPASAVSALASISLLGLRLVQSGTRIISESSSLNYGLAAVLRDCESRWNDRARFGFVHHR